MVEARVKDENSQEIYVKSEGKEAEGFTLGDMICLWWTGAQQSEKGKSGESEPTTVRVDQQMWIVNP